MVYPSVQVSTGTLAEDVELSGSEELVVIWELADKLTLTELDAKLVDEDSDREVPIAELAELPVPVGAYIDVVFEVPYGGDKTELGKTLT